MTTIRRTAVGVTAALAIGVGGCASRASRTPAAPPAAARVEATQVFVDMTIVRVDRAAAEALLGVASEAGRAQGRTISVAEADALTARLRALPGADFVAAPKVLALEGQRASVAVQETPGKPGSTSVLDDEAALALPGASGFLATVTPWVQRGGGRVEADVRLAWKDAAGAATEPVTTLSTRVSLAPSERSVWSVPVASSRPGSRERLVVIVSARALDV